MFTPGKEIWSLSAVEELYRAFVQNPDETSDSFLEKLQRQLSGISNDAIQLAAELLWFHFLTPTGTSGDKKREIIGEVLAWMDEPPTIPNKAAEALDHGFVNGGFAFTTQRPFQLMYLVEFLRHWKQLPADEARRVLSDPWRFRETAWDVPIHRGHSQREALLFLIHPDTFEDTISLDALKKIASRFSDLVDDPTAEVHRQVFQIREKLSDELGSAFGFFDPSVRVQWSPDNTRWGQLIHWMRMFFEDPDFDENERDYKVKLGEAVETARAEVMSGSESWFEHLKHALKHPQNNITPWQMNDTFLKWAAKHETETAAALTALWRRPGNVDENIDNFVAALPKDAFRGGTHSRLTLAAYLHMAEDPISFPPYRYEAFKRVIALVDHAPLVRSEGPIYLHALAFLDEILVQAESRGLVLYRCQALGSWEVERSQHQLACLAF